MNPADFDIEAGRAEWSSFLPALAAVLAETTGAVLEVGVGHYSTPFLHDYCEREYRVLVSLEEDNDWRPAFARKYETALHIFRAESYDTAIREAATRDWSVILLDHSLGPRRGADMALLLDHAEFIVVHDYHLAIKEAVLPYLTDVHYHVVESKPPTLVVSKRRAMPAGVTSL